MNEIVLKLVKDYSKNHKDLEHKIKRLQQNQNNFDYQLLLLQQILDLNNEQSIIVTKIANEYDLHHNYDNSVVLHDKEINKVKDLGLNDNTAVSKYEKE